LKIELSDQERRVVGRLLTERRALVIETTEDTTEPDAERRAGIVEVWRGDVRLSMSVCRPFRLAVP
jgi:hypothetical protein